MRYSLIIGCVFWLTTFMQLKATGNPFDLTPRLSTSEQQARIQPATPSNSNPFELNPRLGEEAIVSPSNTATNAGNPFELATREQISAPVQPQATPVVNRPTDIAVEVETEQSGWLLFGLAGLLGIGAVLLIFFRSLFLKAYRALFNDNLLSQLYREREGATFGQFVLSYLFFFVSAGTFLYLTGNELGWFAGISDQTLPWYCIGAISGVFLLKHLVLSFIGYVFPIAKEVKRYSFTIMVFSIVLGLMLAMASILLAYAPDGAKLPLLYGTAGLTIVAYALRSLRGFFIANRFLGSYLFHFLLYLCAVEIVPVLWLYKYLQSV